MATEERATRGGGKELTENESLLGEPIDMEAKTERQVEDENKATKNKRIDQEREQALEMRERECNDSKIRHICWFCNNSNHWPDQCEKFAARTVDERISAAKTHHVCFSCLGGAGRDPRQAKCSRKKQCTKVEKGSQCTSTYHPLSHKPKSDNVGVAAQSDQNDSMLLVIAANICGSNGVHKSGNALFASGAQISLIRKETAENLGRIGKDTTVNIVKVCGE